MLCYSLVQYYFLDQCQGKDHIIVIILYISALFTILLILFNDRHGFHILQSFIMLSI
jgi:hypothetical protein